MRLLIDISHPAHVHLFRNAIKLWQEKGYQLVITAREKDITTRLLSLYDMDFQSVSKAKKGFTGLLLGLVEHDLGVLRVARQVKCDYMLGTSVAVSHVSRLLAAKSVVFNEDNRESSFIFAAITYPFADYIVTPAVLGEDYGHKHYTYEGCHELAYLHPNYFIPDATVLHELGIGKNEPYSILRFVALGASHDIGQKGIDDNAKRQIIAELLKIGRVFITSECQLMPEFEKYRLYVSPEKIHDVVAYARMFVGDSQSMTIEAALLGTPSIRCNTFIGRTPVIEELQNKYQLTFGFLPQETLKMVDKIRSIVSDRSSKALWQERRAKYIRDKIDVTAWMVKLIEDLAKSSA